MSSATRGCFEVTATFSFSYAIYLMLFLEKRVFCVCFSKRLHSGYLQRGKPSNSLWEIHNYNLKDPLLLFMFAPPQRLYKVTKSWKDSLRKLQTQGLLARVNCFPLWIRSVWFVSTSSSQDLKKKYFSPFSNFSKVFFFFKTTVLQPCFRGLS